jgi:alpha-1,3-rhamnosyl/mannosyltransferase
LEVLLRVAINRLCTSGPQTGIGHYTAQLLRGLYATGAVEIDEVPQGWVWRLHGLGRRLRALSERRRGSPRVEPGRTPGEAPSRPSWAQRIVGWLRRGGQRFLYRHIQSIFARRGLDLYHEPNNVPLPCDLPTVATVHDLSVLLHPEWHPADRVAHFEREFLSGVGRCAHLLTVSEFVRGEIIATLGVPPDRVSVTYNGMRAGLRPLPAAEVAAGRLRLGLPPNYLLYLGTLEPRKNVLMLLRVYCSLPDSLRSRYPLILVGGWGWNTAELADYYHDEARHRGVRHLGYVADAELPMLYNGARALLFPSFYEGYGLPPVEMLACGGAVIASTAGAIVELAGVAAHLIDPCDEDGWRRALLRVTADDDWWRRLRRHATEAAAPYTWERCAADTLAVYRQVLSLPPAMPQPPRLAA